MLIAHLPPESACATLERDGEPHWPIWAHVIDDFRIAMTSSKERQTKPYPTRFPSKKMGKNKVAQIEAARQRRAERLEQIERGEIA